MIKSYPEFYNKRYKYEKYTQEQQENQASASTIGNEAVTNNLVINTQNASISSSSIDESSEHSPSPSSPSSLQPSNSTPAMPLSAITNKLNTKQPIDFAAAYTGIASSSNCIPSNYYQSQNYENFANIHNHFQNNLAPFGGYNVSAHHQVTAPFLQQQQQQQSYSNNNHSLITGGSLTNSYLRSINTNHRNSTGGSSANSSSTSLNSPPSAVSDENSPLHNNIFSNQMHLLQQNHQQQTQHQTNQQSSRFNAPYIMNQQIANGGPSVASDLPPLPPSLNTPTINSSLLRLSSSNSSITNTSMTSEDDDGSGMPLKKRRPVPVENKDKTYWEKRRKNNESAKRSRDIRRSKEEHISIRVIYLEQENLQLRTEVALLRNEAEKLRAMLYGNNANSNSNTNCNGNLINNNTR